MRSVQLALALTGLLAAAAARGEGRRALVVGIGRYAPGSARTPALPGASEDAQAFRALLVARYGFAPDDAVLLLDGDATRDAIVAAFRRVLVAPARPGDVAVFYFAGHGSWMRNSLSREPDRRDETIVAADGRDVRDKELARLMAEAGARGVRLTAVFDSCHSGSIARGLSVLRAVRAAPSDPAADARDGAPAPTPGETGALVLSAAQDDQAAAEVVDDDGRLHGAFTAALLQVLRAAPRGADAEWIALRVGGLLAAAGLAQRPQLDGAAERRGSPPFGPPVAGARAGPRVAAARASGGEVELLAGFAVGLAPGTLLERRDNGRPPVRVRVAEVRGPSRSLARPATDADAAVPLAAGDVFEVVRWAVPPHAALRVALGATAPWADVVAAARALRPLRAAPAIRWVEDPSATAPTHVVRWDGAGWRLRFPDGREEPLGPRPSSDAVARRLARGGVAAGRPAPCDARPCLFVQLPVPAELAARLEAGAAPDHPVERTAEGDAAYLLAGRIGRRGAPEYAWVLASAGQRGAASTLPPRSRWEGAGDAALAADRLDEAARRIARVRAWLTVEAPPGAHEFPYRLALRRAGDPRPLAPGAVLRSADRYEPLLVASPDALAAGSALRHVYVLVVDPAGHVGVLYPSDQVSVDNRFPAVGPGERLPTEIALGAAGAFRVLPPYGADSYVLLATEEPLASVRLLEQDAVARGAPAPAGDGLGDLLARLGATRGAGAAAAGGWSIDRLTAVSAP